MVTRTCLRWRITFRYEPAAEVASASHAEETIIVVPDTTRPGLPGSILDVEPPLPDEPIA